MNNPSLQLIKDSNGLVNPNENIIFEDILYQTGNINYNNETGIITISDPGKYAFWWFIATQAMLSNEGIHFALKLNNVEIIGNSPIKQDQIFGFGFIDVADPQSELSLINKGPNSVHLSTNVDIRANLMINKIPDINNNVEYIDLILTDSQELGFNDFITFSDTYIENGINYDETLNLIAILEPGIYQINFNFF